MIYLMAKSLATSREDMQTVLNGRWRNCCACLGDRCTLNRRADDEKRDDSTIPANIWPRCSVMTMVMLVSDVKEIDTVTVVVARTLECTFGEF